MLQQRALELIDRAQKRARLIEPAADSEGVSCGFGARLAREREAADAEPTICRLDNSSRAEQQSAGQQIAHQVDQLRQQHSSTQFPEMAATALATRLAAAESEAAASDPSAAREADAVLAAIQQLQQSREFNRSRFAAHFLGAAGVRPTVRAMWRLHSAQVVPIEQFLETASDGSLDAIVQGIHSLIAEELSVGRDGEHSRPDFSPDLCRI